jgi:hypothetical protein
MSMLCFVSLAYDITLSLIVPDILESSTALLMVIYAHGGSDETFLDCYHISQCVRGRARTRPARWRRDTASSCLSDMLSCSRRTE